MSTLEKAISIAAAAHAGQMYTDDEPYICHVMRVMLACTNDTERIVAMLHDVVEDAGEKGYDFRFLVVNEFSEEIVLAVAALTHRKSDTYERYIMLCGLNKLARRIKMLDLEENFLHIEDIEDPVRRARLRAKYSNAMVKLAEAELAQN